MDLKILKSVLEAKSVPTINRLTNRNYNLHEPIEIARTSVINEACEHYNVLLCESDADSIIASLEYKTTFTEDQEKIISLLYKHGYNAVSLEPELKESESDSNCSKPIKESKVITESSEKLINTEEIHKEIEESDEIEINKSLLIEKLQMCPYFSSLMMLEKDFNKVGLSINESNNSNVLLCVLNEDGSPKNEEIFKDFMVLGSNNNDIVLTDRIIECIIKFINKVATTAKSKKDIDKNWNSGPAPYGDAVGIDNSGISSSK